jgi:hypothetical protein
MNWDADRQILNLGDERAGLNVATDRSDETVESSTRTVILVLGMHRSGTSSLAGALVRLGGAAPLNLMPAHETQNPRGFWESSILTALNDEMLAAGGSHWDDWREFDPKRIDAAATVALRAHAKSVLTGEFGDASLAIVKDPRMCRLLPFWSSVFHEAEWSVRPVLLLRSPLEVAMSLNRRDDIPLTRGCLIWLRHVLDAEAETRNMRRAVLNWSDFLADRCGALERIGVQLGLAWPRWSDGALAEIDEFISADLKHESASEEDLKVHSAVSDLVRDTNAVMIELVKDPSNGRIWSKVGDARARFEDAAAIFGQAMFETEEESRSLQWLAKCERQEHDAQLSERDAQLVEKDQLIAERVDELIRMKASLAERDAQLVEKDQLIAERVDELIRMKASLAERDAELVEKGQLIAERDKQIARTNATLADLNRELARRNILIDKLEATIWDRESELARKDAVLSEQTNHIAFTQLELESASAKLDRAEQTIAYVSQKYGNARKKNVFKNIRYALRLALKGKPVRTKRYNLIRDSVFFDKNFYVSANPDVKATGVDPVIHYLLRGSEDGRDPGPFFSEVGYRAGHSDVAKETLSSLEHYERYGRVEGRRLFAAGPLVNLLPREGSSEHLSTSLTTRNPLASYGSHSSEEQGPMSKRGGLAARDALQPVACFAPAQELGPAAEGTLRKPPTTADTGAWRKSIERSGLFDPSTYLAMHPDLMAAGADPWEHFVHYGLKEGRRFTTSHLFARALSRSNAESQDALWAVHQALAAQSGDDYIWAAAAPVASSSAKIGVYCNSLGNFFMQEIANLVHWQFSALNFDSQLRTEESDPAEAFDIRIFVAPHEFFWLGQGAIWRHLVQASGTVLFNVEQVQTAWFCKGLSFLLEAPLVFDLNFQSAVLLRRMGCNAIHYMPPYLEDCSYTRSQPDVSEVELVRGYEFSKSRFDWRKHQGLSDRPIDIIFIGSESERRVKAIERLRELTDKYRFVCVYTHQDRPLTTGNYRTTSPEINCALSQRSKIVLNIHRDWIGYFEWSRMVMQGFWQGACVVSDPSLPDPVFSPDRHFLEENFRHLPELIRWLLGTAEGRAKMDEVGAAGYDHARSPAARAVMLVPMLNSLRDLVALSRAQA